MVKRIIIKEADEPTEDSGEMSINDIIKLIKTLRELNQNNQAVGSTNIASPIPSTPKQPKDIDKKIEQITELILQELEHNEMVSGLTIKEACKLARKNKQLLHNKIKEIYNFLNQ